MLSTPNTIRTLQRKLYHKAKQEGACLMKKSIGKPCTGKPYARFDEGGRASITTVRLLRHRQTKWAVTDRFDLRMCDARFLLYQETVDKYLQTM